MSKPKTTNYVKLDISSIGLTLDVSLPNLTIAVTGSMDALLPILMTVWEKVKPTLLNQSEED